LKSDIGFEAPDYPRPKADGDSLREECQKMFATFLENASSKFVARATVAPKKNEKGEMTGKRFCVNYMRLNAITVDDPYRMPGVDECLKMKTARFFTKIDLKSGFWQVKLKEGDRYKTAFRIGTQALLQWKVMPMGLKNSPKTFQKLIDRVLGKTKGVFTHGYVDDIAIYSDTWDQHVIHVRDVLERLNRHNLKINLPKCVWGSSAINFLGHVIAHGSVQVDPKKVEAVGRMPPPDNRDGKGVKLVQRFLGMSGFYRKFVWPTLRWPDH